MTISLNDFTFSGRADVVDVNDLILIPGGSSVSTLSNDDSISTVYTTNTPTITFPERPEAVRDAVFGIYNQGSFDTSSGNDVVIGNVTYTGESVAVIDGISQAFNGANNGFSSANLSTGSGDDRVLGFANSSNSIEIRGIGNLLSSEINTGEGNDEIKGEATGNATNGISGISQNTGLDFPVSNNLITTGNGDDKVIGKVNNGSSNGDLDGISQFRGNNQIITDNGNDQVIGEASGSGGTVTGISSGVGNNQITTGNGSDEIIGEASGDASQTLGGIVQASGSSQIITGGNNDKVIGKANGNLNAVTFQGADGQQLNPAIVGISQQGGGQQISTENGSDEVRGTASGTATASVGGGLVSIVGIVKSDSSIETGANNDKVIGEASGTADQVAGIVQQGSTDVITTGRGDDEVIGTASGSAITALAGIAQQPGTAGSQIITGEGNDKIIGTAANNAPGITAGILGDLDINTGAGDDEVVASATVFGTRIDGFAAANPFTGQGSVTVDTGSGSDLVKGFGQGSFNGGEGSGDVYDLSEYSFSEFTIAIGAGGNNEVNFTQTDLVGESTAFTQGFEIFRFADGQLSFSDLA